MKFKSEKYPSLQVGTGPTKVRFVDGEADVDDADRVKALKALPAGMGVKAAGGRPPKDDDKKPKDDDKK